MTPEDWDNIFKAHDEWEQLVDKYGEHWFKAHELQEKYGEDWCFHYDAYLEHINSWSYYFGFSSN